MSTAKITPCLWFDGNAEEAANFYAATFPDSHVTSVQRAPGDYPAGKAGDALTVEFTVCGMAFLGLNGGAGRPFTEAISFQVFTDTQEETDRYWNAIVGNGGAESQCSWCRDRFRPVVADRAACADGGDGRSRPRRRQARHGQR